MDYFAQQLINGFVLGSIYGLIAIGYTMVYGIVGMINFAHGDIFMIGGFIALITFLILVSIGLTVVPVILLIVVLSFIFINRFGFSGAVTGILLAVLVATVLFIRWSSPSTDYPFSRIIQRAYLKPVLCSVLALLLVLALARPSQLGWAGLLVHCGGFGAIYLAGLILVRFFDQFDLHQAEGFLPFARIARKIIAA